MFIMVSKDLKFIITLLLDQLLHVFSFYFFFQMLNLSSNEVDCFSSLKQSEEPKAQDKVDSFS